MNYAFSFCSAQILINPFLVLLGIKESFGENNLVLISQLGAREMAQPVKVL